MGRRVETKLAQVRQRDRLQFISTSDKEADDKPMLGSLEAGYFRYALTKSQGV
jgi:hypothetical protein